MTIKKNMKLLFFQEAMYYFEVELLVNERLGKDLGTLLMSFLKEDPKPWCWPVSRPLLSPWDPLVEVDPCDGIELPLFAP